MARAYDFPVTFTSRHEECEDSFKRAAIEQTLKLSRYYNHIIDADITINGKQPLTKVEIIVRVPGAIISAMSEDYNRTVALDAAVEKAKVRLKRHKDRLADHHRAPSVLPDEGDETTA